MPALVDGTPWWDPTSWFSAGGPLDPSTWVSTGLGVLAHVLLGGFAHLAGWLISQVLAGLTSTTAVSLDGWFSGPWAAMLRVSALLAVPMLAAGVIQSLLHGDAREAIYRGFGGPLAAGVVLLLARGLTGALMAAVSGVCWLVVQVGVGGPSGLVTPWAALVGTGVGGGVFGGAVSAPMVLLLVVVLLCGVTIWLELAVRAAIIYLLVAFVPLAVGGLFWGWGTRWARRIGELLLAAILSQLVITVTMVLGAAALKGARGGQGFHLGSSIGAVSTAVGMLLLGSFGLPVTLRLIPHVTEASAALGLAGPRVAAAGRRVGTAMGGVATGGGAAVAGGSISTGAAGTGAGRVRSGVADAARSMSSTRGSNGAADSGAGGHG